MKGIIIFISLCIGLFHELNAQNSTYIWTHKIFDYSVTFDFEEEPFKVDTINSYEGYVFYFLFLNDSSYFRLNYISPNAKFECCMEDTIYKETKVNNPKGIIDRRGKVDLSNLYWREIQNRDIEIVYNNCSAYKLKPFNKIMDSIFYRLLNAKK